MNVWIFALSALLSPIIEPMGLDIGPASPPAAQSDFIEPTMPTMPEQQMRYRGIEQLLTQLDSQPTP